MTFSMGKTRDHLILPCIISVSPIVLLNNTTITTIPSYRKSQQESDSLAVSLKSCKTLVKEIYKPLRIFTHFRPDFVSTVKKSRGKKTVEIKGDKNGKMKNDRKGNSVTFNKK